MFIVEDGEKLGKERKGENGDVRERERERVVFHDYERGTARKEAKDYGNDRTVCLHV